jgi:hypothetical protein
MFLRQIDWVINLVQIPQKTSVNNVYDDLGQIFAQSAVAEPRLFTAILGQFLHVAKAKDKVALAKLNYDDCGDGRTNLRYGYMQA